MSQSLTQLLLGYLPLIVFVGVAGVIGLALLVVAFIVAYKQPDPEKLSAYECGFNAFDDARMKFDVRFYLVAILFIIVIAWVNYINLSTARSVERAKEVGVRKVLGSSRGQLLTGFLWETATLVLLAIVVACFLAQLTLPALRQLLERPVSLDLLSSPATVLSCWRPACWSPSLIARGCRHNPRRTCRRPECRRRW